MDAEGDAPRRCFPFAFFPILTDLLHHSAVIARVKKCVRANIKREFPRGVTLRCFLWLPMMMSEGDA